MEQLIAANYQICLVNENHDDSKSPMYKCEGLFAEFLRKFKPGYGQMKSVERKDVRIDERKTMDCLGLDGN